MDENRIFVMISAGAHFTDKRRRVSNFKFARAPDRTSDTKFQPDRSSNSKTPWSPYTGAKICRKLKIRPYSHTTLTCGSGSIRPCRQRFRGLIGTPFEHLIVTPCS